MQKINSKNGFTFLNIKIEATITIRIDLMKQIMKK
jgi:hypothetical protein